MFEIALPSPVKVGINNPVFKATLLTSLLNPFGCKKLRQKGADSLPCFESLFQSGTNWVPLKDFHGFPRPPDGLPAGLLLK
jgi:hypothetical protein